MTLKFKVAIGSRLHIIRVDVPDQFQVRSTQEELHQFVLTTAYLEHFGYLPQEVVNAVE